MTSAARPDEPRFCDTFTEFVERVALPRLLKIPRAIRLDGQDTGGNREVAGRFYCTCPAEPSVFAVAARRACRA